LGLTSDRRSWRSHYVWSKADYSRHCADVDAAPRTGQVDRVAGGRCGGDSRVSFRLSRISRDAAPGGHDVISGGVRRRIRTGLLWSHHCCNHHATHCVQCFWRVRDDHH
jgi:hypothetical protein